MPINNIMDMPVWNPDIAMHHAHDDIAIDIAPVPHPPDDFDDVNHDDFDDEPHDDGPHAIKKKMQVPIFPQSKTYSPAHLPREILFDRAGKIPHPEHIGNDDQCHGCACRFGQHGKRGTRLARCARCGEYCGFISEQQINRVQFTEFLRWSRRWLKAGKKRTISRLNEIWNRIRSLSHLCYCGTCDAPTFINGLHGIVKRQDGLQCASCRQCANCCKCVACDTCKRRKRDLDICKACNVCNQCCQCRQCQVCNRDCSYNYCGYAFTDRQKRSTPGCNRCYNCCDCGHYRKVPFGSFRTPIFHKPTLKQHNINPTSRYISAEIECSGIGGYGKLIYDVVRHWGGGTVGDGSLNERGFEINSSPAGGDLYAQQINEICAAIKLQNGSIDRRCGLHVHVDARDMNYYDIRRLVRVYAAIEDALFSMVSPERLEGVIDADGKLHQYCQPCGKKYIAAIEEGRLPYDKIKSDIITSVYSRPSTQDLRYRKRGNGIPRYNALNLHSWFYRGTIEARMFDGCIEPDPIIRWGIMWAMIADYAVKSSDEQIDRNMIGKPFACLAKIVGHDKNIFDFVKGRVLLFGNGQAQRDAIEFLK